MAISIARRKFIVALGSTAVGWPLVARAAVPVIGSGLLSPEAVAPEELAAFRQGLSETAYVEGQNVAIDYRWAHGQYDQLPALAFDLVRQRVTVLAALGTPASALAAKTATTTIPIVFVTGDDPVRIGLVDSLNRPGGNATGVYMLTSALEPKRLELIHELVPNTTAVGVIVDPSSPDTSRLQMKELPAAASALGQQIKIFNARSEAEIDTAFAAIVKQRIGAVLVASSPSFLPRRQRFVALAAAHALPAVYFVRPFADVGGLMSYGTNIVEPFRQVGLSQG